MGQSAKLTLRPIGQVVRGRTPERPDGWEDEEAVIEVEPKWVEGLQGLDGFSHIWILWWLHQMGAPPDSMRVRPQRRSELPEVGLFSTRSPRRPNPLAMTAVQLIERDGGTLRVRGLDAYQGTPVLDIKPYLTRGDLIADATGPDWLRQLWDINDQERG
jgi:tRNA-Thr(GGU) m(6)t(6)A37 methyltransferase TsaA